LSQGASRLRNMRFPPTNGSLITRICSKFCISVLSFPLAICMSHLGVSWLSRRPTPLFQRWIHRTNGPTSHSMKRISTVHLQSSRKVFWNSRMGLSDCLFLSLLVVPYTTGCAGSPPFTCCILSGQSFFLAGRLPSPDQRNPASASVRHRS
jgi:hypothetical protein